MEKDKNKMENKKLAELLEHLEYELVQGTLDREIPAVIYDSRKVVPGCLFLCIGGANFDGHDFAAQVAEQGAGVLVVQKDVELPENVDVTVVKVADTRYAMAFISAAWFGHPAEKLKVIGITGTKGKTTTTYMIKEILEKAGHKVGLIGTIATYINGRMVSESSRTTPESIELQKTFAQMVEDGVEYVVMEVSSQSLKLHRVDGCAFDIVLFTNFSEDHISEKEHPDMKDYFESKLKLFKMCDNGIINVDDLQVSKIPRLLPENKIMTYGIDNYCEVLAKDITITNSYVDFRVKVSDRNERVKVDIPGRFSVYNALAAICVAKKLGIASDKVIEALAEIKVPGRSEMVPNKKEIPIMIDYAHSPESLQNILSAVKSYTRGRVISVFGCGGDRDKGKRPLMGEISGKIADFTFITTDNPRTEEPEEIVKEIEEGMKKTNGKYKVVVDRKEAIKEAIEMANKLDIIVLAGKGHEPYQEINGTKYPFDERIIVKEIIG